MIRLLVLSACGLMATAAFAQYPAAPVNCGPNGCTLAPTAVDGYSSYRGTSQDVHSQRARGGGCWNPVPGSAYGGPRTGGYGDGGYGNADYGNSAYGGFGDANCDCGSDCCVNGICMTGECTTGNCINGRCETGFGGSYGDAAYGNVGYRNTRYQDARTRNVHDLEYRPAGYPSEVRRERPQYQVDTGTLGGRTNGADRTRGDRYAPPQTRGQYLNRGRMDRDQFEQPSFRLGGGPASGPTGDTQADGDFY